MDTKSKNRSATDNGQKPLRFKAFQGRKIGTLLSVVLLLALSAFFLLFGQGAYYTAHNSQPSYFEDGAFISALYQQSYGANWKLQQKLAQDYTITPFETYYPQLSALLSAVPEDSNDDGTYTVSNEGTLVASAALSEDASLTLNDETISTLYGWQAATDTIIENWYADFDYTWSNLDYLALDIESGISFGNSTGNLEQLATGSANDAALADLRAQYRYYAVLSFDENGRLSVFSCYGAQADSFEALDYLDADEYLRSDDGNALLRQMGTLNRPQNVALVFAVPAGAGFVTTFHTGEQWYDYATLVNSGFGLFYFFTICLCAAFGILMVRAKRFALASTRLARQPLEISLLCLLPALTFYETFASLLVRFYRGGLFTDSFSSVGTPLAIYWLEIIGMLALFFLVFGAVYSAAMSLWQMRSMGIKAYFKEKTLYTRFWRWLKPRLQRLWRKLTAIDLTDSSSRLIFRLVLVNFIILTVLCCFWFAGLFGVVLYSVILFFVLRRYTQELKRQYAALLQEVKEMAGGNLAVKIEDDLGVFAPIGEELQQVQQGFTAAVEAETRSQNMKTELITNVSHDLKTPLTAIITYIGLLKQEGISDEERRSYIETLDKKSQRLKRLIEDLFEMSKASSRDIVLQLSKVDLPALIRQVELEARDDLAAAGIEFRYHFPAGKTVLLLDGERTSRIFENLIVNVAKYAAAGTRAHVRLVAGEKEVMVEMNNVSRDELTFDDEEITERFVRGDASRSTEGSGLGLAIAKSFTEAQGGQFTIKTDADLFKAIITFPIRSEKEAPAPPTEE